jgi:cytidine deaminase
MERKKIQIEFLTHPDRRTLSEEDQQLLMMAATATETAYAPYSDFRVGAAILDIHGSSITGSNQENASFPIGQCAERVALYRMIHELGRTEIKTMAIIVDSTKQRLPASPCGSCRQILAEYRSHQSRTIRLLLGTKDQPLVYEFSDVTDLLPLAFNGSFMGL